MSDTPSHAKEYRYDGATSSSDPQYNQMRIMFAFAPNGADNCDAKVNPSFLPADGRTPRVVTRRRIADHDYVRRHADPFSAAPASVVASSPSHAAILNGHARVGRPPSRCACLRRCCAGLYGKIGWYRKGPGSGPFMLQASISNYVADFELR